MMVIFSIVVYTHLTVYAKMFDFSDGNSNKRPINSRNVPVLVSLPVLHLFTCTCIARWDRHSSLRWFTLATVKRCLRRKCPRRTWCVVTFVCEWLRLTHLYWRAFCLYRALDPVKNWVTAACSLTFVYWFHATKSVAVLSVSKRQTIDLTR